MAAMFLNRGEFIAVYLGNGTHGPMVEVIDRSIRVGSELWFRWPWQAVRAGSTFSADLRIYADTDINSELRNEYV